MLQTSERKRSQVVSVVNVVDFSGCATEGSDCSDERNAEHESGRVESLVRVYPLPS